MQKYCTSVIIYNTTQRTR